MSTFSFKKLAIVKTVRRGTYIPLRPRSLPYAIRLAVPFDEADLSRYHAGAAAPENRRRRKPPRITFWHEEPNADRADATEAMLDDPTSDLGMHRQAMRQHGMHEVQLGPARQLTISMKSSQGGYSANECMQLLLSKARESYVGAYLDCTMTYRMGIHQDSEAQQYGGERGQRASWGEAKQLPKLDPSKFMRPTDAVADTRRYEELLLDAQEFANNRQWCRQRGIPTCCTASTATARLTSRRSGPTRGG